MNGVYSLKPDQATRSQWLPRVCARCHCKLGYGICLFPEKVTPSVSELAKDFYRSVFAARVQLVLRNSHHACLAERAGLLVCLLHALQRPVDLPSGHASDEILQLDCRYGQNTRAEHKCHCERIQTTHADTPARSAYCDVMMAEHEDEEDDAERYSSTFAFTAQQRLRDQLQR